MVALTSRLNERDDAIVQLQRELEAYDKSYAETEELLDIRNQRVKQLEKILESYQILLPDFQPVSSKREISEIGDEDFEYFEKMISKNAENELIGNQIEQSNPDHKNRELEINSNMDELRVEFQDKINLLNEKHLQQQNTLKCQLQESEKNNNELLTIIQEKIESDFLGKQYKENVQILKTKIDSIINELSIENKPENLHLVAKDLLTLHKYIDNLHKITNIKLLEFSQTVQELHSPAHKKKHTKVKKSLDLGDLKSSVRNNRKTINIKKKNKKKNSNHTQNTSKSIKNISKTIMHKYNSFLPDYQLEQMKTIKDSHYPGKKVFKRKVKYQPSDILNYFKN